MLSKRDEYHVGFSQAVRNAGAATSDELRQLWSNVANSYRILLEFEDRYPTRAAGRDGLVKRRGDVLL